MYVVDLSIIDQFHCTHEHSRNKAFASNVYFRIATYCICTSGNSVRSTNLLTLRVEAGQFFILINNVIIMSKFTLTFFFLKKKRKERRKRKVHISSLGSLFKNPSFIIIYKLTRMLPGKLTNCCGCIPLKTGVVIITVLWLVCF